MFFYDRRKGLRSGKKLTEFDIIAFTFPYELDYVKALEILESVGIPARRKERKGPFLMAGGIAAMANPFVLSPFFDLIAVGEAEAIIPEFMEIWKGGEIDALADREWAFIPGKKEEAARVYLQELSLSEGVSAFLDSEAYFGDTLLVETGRGCPHKCRFCLLGYAFLPPRFLPLENFRRALESAPSFKKVGLVSSAVAEHPHFDEMLRMIQEASRVTVSSLRIDAVREETLRELKRRGLVTLTVAPEAGTERLRNSINKGLSDAQLIEFAALAHKTGFHRMKLYFMIGIPGETIEDVEAVGELTSSIKKAFRGQISVTVSPFVPKPHTPFQNVPLEEREKLERKLKSIKMPRGVVFRTEGLRHTEIQAVLSRGDRAVGEAIYASWEKRRSLFREMKERGIDPDKYLRDPCYLREAPFHKISTGVRADFLRMEFERSKKGRRTPDCDTQKCKLCGLCVT